jgi:uncharacterized protein (TIGR03435 family)
MVRTGVVLVALALLVVGTGAQQRLAFEVASARFVLDMNVPTTADFRFSNLVTEQRVHLVQSLRAILERALGIKGYQLVAPDWTNGWLVEIRGTFPPDTTMEHVPGMLHALLIERFGLVTHAETRAMDAYQLVVGATGINMREVEAANDLDKKFDDALMTSSGSTDRTIQTADGPVRTMQVPGARRRITARTMYERTTGLAANGARITATRMTMAELVSILTPNIGEPVVDKTGLTGIYQFTIELPEDEATRRVILLSRRFTRERFGLPPTDVTDDRPPAAATTLKAVEGLGLRLERRRLPIDVVVIDSIQRQPTEN